MEIAWDWMLGISTASGAPGIRFVTERGDETAGTGEPQFTVHASRFELFRATSGRRTEDEIACYEWEPAPEATRLVGSPLFTMRTDSLGE
jgi:hypothetical protein